MDSFMYFMKLICLLDSCPLGCDKMLKEFSTKYKNITHRDIELYINLCELCQKKQKDIPKEQNFHCQVDLIAFVSAR